MLTKTIENGKLRVVEDKTLNPAWGKENFSNYNEQFKKARSGMKDKMNRCYCCDWPFQVSGEGENVNLVHFNYGVGNKLVCDDCFKELKFEQ